MTRVSGDRRAKWHDIGEQDGSRGEFKPPRNPRAAPFWSGEDLTVYEAYKEGHENAKEQNQD